MTKLYVHGVGHFHPENVIDNAFLEDLDIGTAALSMPRTVRGILGLALMPT